MNSIDIVLAAIIIAAGTSFIVCNIMNNIFQNIILKRLEHMYEEIEKVTIETIRESINSK
jgi:hypothetical protein